MTQKVRGFTVSHCETCTGLWLPAHVVAIAVGGVPGGNVQSNLFATHLRCPQDRAVLVAVHHRDVELDFCTTCGGVWLDRGELDQILQQRHKLSRKSDNADWPRSLVDMGSEILSSPEALSAVGDIAGDALGAVLTFVAEALSGF